MRKLYCCYVRPYLGFASAAWNPYLRGNVDLIEKLQKKATRIHDTKGLRYPQRLERFNLQSLEEHRKSGDLIQFQKIVDGLDSLNWYHPPRKSGSNAADTPASNLRGHSRKNFKVGGLKSTARETS